MTRLTVPQLYQYAQAAGFSGAAADEVVAIAQAESGGDTTHINDNPNGSTATVNGQTVQVPAHTKDYGVLQINTWWNPSVTIAQAEDPTFAFQWAYQKTGGKQPTTASDPFKPYWVTVQNGAYRKYLTSGGSSGSSGSSASKGALVSNALPSNVIDPCTNCGAVGSAAYNACKAAGTASGTLPTCAQTSIDPLGIGALQADIQQFVAEIPNLLVHIGLFLVALILIIVGFVILVNSDQTANISTGVPT